MLPHLRSMLGRMQSLAQKIRTHRSWLAFFGITTALGLVFLVQPAFAAQEADWLIQGAASIMLVVANIALGLTIFFLRFFIMIASYNNYIDVDVVQLGWIMVRDIANMFFVVALLVIAFGTILGLEEYEWKKNLVKLILAAILINFSNLIAQLVIDVAHVFSITFLNAISATAGGNLITMFKLEAITGLAAPSDGGGSINLNLFAAALVGMMFAVMAACAMGSYLVVMMARVVALWALIILSPLAFVLGVLPKTKSYAEKWWSEFSKYVIVAPVMVFFLWLSFATLGLGNIVTQIESGIDTNNRVSGTDGKYGLQDPASVSWAKISSWENMANFFVAFAFLMYGIKATQETGVVGSSAVGSAVDFGKKVASIASGYTAARWVGGKAIDGTKWAAKEVGTFAAKRAGVYDVPENIANWYKAKSAAWDKYAFEGPLAGWVDKQNVGAQTKVGADYKLTDEDKANKLALTTRQVKDEKTGEITTEHYLGKVIDKDYKLTAEEEAKGYRLDKERYIDTDGKEKEKYFVGRKDFLKDKNGDLQYKSGYQKWINRRKQKLIAGRKALEKTEKEGKLNEELLDKRTEGLAVNTYFENWGLKDKGWSEKDYDRIKSGMLEVEEERSAAKTREFKNEGAGIVLNAKRLKGEGGKPIEFQEKADSVAGQIAAHKTRGDFHEKRREEIVAKAMSGFKSKSSNSNWLTGKIRAELEVKAQNADIHKVEETLMSKEINAGFANFADRMDTLRETDKEKNNRLKELRDKKAGALTDEEKTELETLTTGEEAREKRLAVLKTKLEPLTAEEITEQAALSAETGRLKTLEQTIETKRANVLTEEEKNQLIDLQADPAADNAKFNELKKKQNRTEQEERLLVDWQAKRATLQTLQEKKKNEDEVAEYEKLQNRFNELAVKESKSLTSAEKEELDQIRKQNTKQKKLFARKDLEKILPEEEAELAVLNNVDTVKAELAEAEKRIAKEKALAKEEKRPVTQAASFTADELRKKDLVEKYDTDTAAEKLWQDMAKSGNPVARRMAAEKAGHTEGLKVAEIEKAIESIYFSSKAGLHELGEEAALAAKNAIHTAVVEGKKELENANFYKHGLHHEGGDHDDHPPVTGKDLYVKLLETQQAALEGKALVQDVQDKAGKELSKTITALVSKALEGGGGDSLKHLSEANPFVRAQQAIARAAESKNTRTTFDADRNALIEGEYVEREILGRTTPSRALVEAAKRSVDSMSTMTASAIGKAVTDTFAHVALQLSRNGFDASKLDDEAMLGLFGTINGANGQANVDDGLFDMADELNKHEKLKNDSEYRDTDKFKRNEALKEVFANKLKLIKKDKVTGEYLKAVNKAESVSIMQQFAVSGGDIDLVQKSQAISALSKEKGLTYDKAVKEYFAGNDQEEHAFFEKMKSRDTYYAEAANTFTNQALATKHLQLGGHFKFDADLGFHRMATEEEAKAEMLSQMAKTKDSKTNTQVHSFAELTTHEGNLIAQKIDREMYAITVGTMQTKLEVKNEQERTRDLRLGQYNREKAVLNGVNQYELAAGQVNKRFGSVQRYLVDSLLPQLSGGIKAFALGAAHKSGQDLNNAEDLKVKIAIKDAGIGGDDLFDVVGQIEKKVNSGEIKMEGLSAKEVKDFNEMLALAKKEALAITKAAADRKKGETPQEKKAREERERAEAAE